MKKAGRHGAFAHGMRTPTLTVFCAQTAASALLPPPKGVEVKVLKAFESVTAGEYVITALPARHMAGGEAFIYLIKGDKTLLYAHDTGYFHGEVFDYLAKQGAVLDAVSLDCTNVDIPISDEGSHMGFANIARLKERLAAMGVITDATLCYVNHFSHNARPLQRLLEERAAEYRCFVAHDGLQLNF